jgi:hypothetical protein
VRHVGFTTLMYLCTFVIYWSDHILQILRTYCFTYEKNGCGVQQQHRRQNKQLYGTQHVGHLVHMMLSNES